MSPQFSGKKPVEKPFKERFKEILSESTVQFCNDSTLHGLKNICKEVQAPASTG